MTDTSGPTARTRVLIVFGGRSSEHPVSCVTAVGVLNAIDRTRFDVVPVGITPQGTWSADAATTQAPQTWDVHSLTGNQTPAEDTHGAALSNDLPEVQEPAHPAALRNGVNGVQLVDSISQEVISDIDVVFPLLHGPFGEDGTVQGMFETLGVPYVGPGVLASSVGMDKHFMKVAFQHAGLKVSPWVTFTDRQWQSDQAQCIKRAESLQFPVFVKPARGGSSLGIAKVDDATQLATAVEEARVFDPKVIVEEGVVGREIECAVLDGFGTESPRVSYPGEIEVQDSNPDHQFYDFEAKYQDSSAAELSCPARIPDEAIARVRELAVTGFDAVDAAGLSRVDFFYTTEGDFVINEINTMPGFTSLSMYPSMWQRTGVEYEDLITTLIDLAVQRGTGLH